ncbi:MAG: hypothetical protein ACK4YP_23480 [Myxococcota bacterium]
MSVPALAFLLLTAPAHAGSNAGVPDRLAALEARVAELEASNTACRADLNALAEESAAQAADLDALDADVTTLESIVSNVVLDADRFEALLDEALARIPVHTPDWTDLDDRVSVLELDVAWVRAELGGVLDCLTAWARGQTCDTDPNGG